MNIHNSLDLFLYIAMIIDLMIKSIKLLKIKREMKKYHRYKVNWSKLKAIIFWLIVVSNIVYIGLRFYQVIYLHYYNFHTLGLIFPVLLYYGLFEYYINGIYFNDKMIYYKHQIIRFGNIIRSFRFLKDGMYHYEINYRHEQGGTIDFSLQIKDEKEAYLLLAMIPFEEIEFN